ncbi:hypothetical protein [Trichothermofontia sp.]
MNSSSQVNELLKTLATLDLDDQALIAETLQHRLRELRRDHILARANEAEHNYQLGEVFTGTLEDLMQHLTDED